MRKSGQGAPFYPGPEMFVMVQGSDGRLRSLTREQAEIESDQGTARPAHRYQVWPPGSPPMAEVVYGPEVTRVAGDPVDPQTLKNARDSYRQARTISDRLS